MTIVRSTVFLLGQILFTIFFSTLALLTFPLPRLTRYRFIALWAKTMLVWLRLTCGTRFRVEGLEHLPAEPCVILSKHQSAWETLAFQKIFPPVCWVLKRELLWLPFFGWALKLASPIGIDRKAGKEALKQVATQGRERLRQGFCVVVFPERTRVAPGVRGRYNAGGALLATQAGVPVLPIAHNAGLFWGKGAFLKYPGEICVRIGPPLSSQGIKASVLIQQVENWIEGAMATLPAQR